MDDDFGQSPEHLDITLRLYFTGMMVFADRGDEMVALVVDMRAGEPTKKPPIPPHRPVVQVALANLTAEEQDRQRDWTLDAFPLKDFRDAFGSEQRIWVLDCDVLEAGREFMYDTELKVCDLPLDGSALPRNAPHGESLGWMAPLLGRDGEPPKLRKGLLERFQPREGENPLVAAVRFRRGELRTVAFAAEMRRFVVWESPFPGVGQRTVSTVTEYSVRYRFPRGTQQPEIRLTTRKFDDSPGRELILTPEPGKNFVEVWILNLEWEQIQRQHPPRPVRLNDENPELLFYYDLLDNAPCPSELPKAIRHEQGVVDPALYPCEDPAMKRLYFPSASGEIQSAAPCCPARIPKPTTPQAIAEEAA